MKVAVTSRPGPRRSLRSLRDLNSASGPAHILRASLYHALTRSNTLERALTRRPVSSAATSCASPTDGPGEAERRWSGRRSRDMVILRLVTFTLLSSFEGGE